MNLKEVLKDVGAPMTGDFYLSEYAGCDELPTRWPGCTIEWFVDSRQEGCAIWWPHHKYKPLWKGYITTDHCEATGSAKVLGDEP